MNLTPFIALLRREMGLDPASIGEGAVVQALHRRMAANGCLNEGDYSARLSVSPEEVQELIEEVSVPETWFFREKAAFECLRSQARQDLTATGKQRPFNVGCLPCATGEEAYSIAMALLDMGLAPVKFRVHALDISYRALVRAQQAVYGEYSFRAADKTFRERYFQASAEGYQVIQSVRDQVSFYHGSVLALPTPFVSAIYDVLFCRNLLIYLDNEARKRFVAGLKMILAPGGILLVGHSEVVIALHEGFERSGDGALRLRQDSTPPTAQPSIRKRPERHLSKAENKGQGLRPMPFASVAKALPAEPTGPVAVAPDEIGNIRALADVGRLNEARASCDACIQKGGHSAELYCLLGVILNAQGDAAAARDSYRKAMYLDPQHVEARQLLVMIEQRSGLDRRSPEASHTHGSRRREDGHG
jgi:chemotaxis protein methyltransferase WspC